MLYKPGMQDYISGEQTVAESSVFTETLERMYHSPGAYALPFRIGTLGELSQVTGKASQRFLAFILVELRQQAQGLDNITPVRTLSLGLGLPGSATKRNQVGCPENIRISETTRGFAAQVRQAV